MTDLEDELRTIRTKRTEEIKARMHTASDEQSKLHQLLTEHPELFEGKQCAVTVDGVKVGYRKQRGKVTVSDESATIKRIRERLPADQAVLSKFPSASINSPSMTSQSAI